MLYFRSIAAIFCFCNLFLFSSFAVSDQVKYAKFSTGESLFTLNFRDRRVILGDVALPLNAYKNEKGVFIDSDFFLFALPVGVRKGECWSYQEVSFCDEGVGRFVFLDKKIDFIKVTSTQKKENMVFYYSPEFGLVALSLSGDFENLAVCVSDFCTW